VVTLADGGFAISSPAKINLGLRILGKRPDGYHEINTVFQEISLCDKIEFHPAHDWSLEVRGADLDSGASNLVSRAAALLSREAGVPCHASVLLDKRIPIGGGLGGGSSNAAITLIGLNRLWNIGISTIRLRELAADIGSDCAFFIHGGLAQGTGRGEILDLRRGHFQGEIVIAAPGFSVSTKWAFGTGRFPLTNAEKSVILPLYSCSMSVRSHQLEVFGNDFESIVFSKYSELFRIKQTFLEHGAVVSMLAGSGSSVFGIFKERSQAMHAAQQLEKPCQAYLCQPIGRPR
jgi:4-diphosphocytidyl-2-C-methyl-D-erythritol kinase